MAQLDANIPLQIKQPQFEDINAIRARGLQVQQLTRADEQAQRELSEQRTIRDLYQQSIGADGQIDSTKLVRGVASAGLGDRIPTIQKQVLDAQGARIDIRKKGIDADTAQFEQQKKKLDLVNGSLSSLVANPNVTQQDVIAQINTMVDQGIITAEEGAKSARALPGRPEQLRPYLVQKALEAAEGSKRLETLLPKYDEQDRGGTINTGTIDPLTGTRTGGADVQKTVSPDAAATAAAMTANPAVTYTQDSHGNLVATPSRAAPGAPITAQEVLGPDGKPLSGKSTSTEDQAKAAGWLSQATNAFANMKAAKTNDPSAARPGLAEFVSAIPSMGVGEAVGNVLRTPDRQKFVQASSSLSEALLRAATGAGVNENEAKQKVAELTPGWGDSDEVIAQKEAAVPIYLESLRTRAGNAGRAATAPTGPRPPLDAFFRKPK